MSEGMGGTPIIDEIDKRRLDLIRKTVAKNCTDGEIATFLELAARYDLDPFAKEIWCAKDDKPNARVLIMVGRDGLRKIAQRQGFHIDGDVVRDNDEFKITRDATGRTVTHSYGHEKDRGSIVGAWCQVTALPRFDAMGSAPMFQAGFFYAPLSEYKPRNAHERSPWSKQTSVMILAAAERQALRQATPLGGLLAEGEDESAQAQLTAGEGSGEPVGWKGVSVKQATELEEMLKRAQEVGHSGLSNRATVEMTVNGQSEAYVADYIAAARDVLSTMRTKRDQETADVILDAAETPACDGSADCPATTHVHGCFAEVPADDPERIAGLNQRRDQLLDEITELEGDDGLAGLATIETLRKELDFIEAELGGKTDPGQTEMGL